MARRTSAAILAAALMWTLGAAAWAQTAGVMIGKIPPIQKSVVDPNQEYQAGLEALRTGQYAAAARAFTAVLQVEHNHPRTLFRLGEARQGQGDDPGAAEAYGDALKADPSLFLVRRALALTDIRLGRTDAAKAELERLTVQAARCDPDCSIQPYVESAASDVRAALADPTRAVETPRAD